MSFKADVINPYIAGAVYNTVSSMFEIYRNNTKFDKAVLVDAQLTLQPPNYSIWIFTHLKLCLADAIHNFKWVKIIQIWQNGGQLFSNIADWCHILSLTCLKGAT